MAEPPKIRLPYPHQGQQIVRADAKRFNWIAAGRRWRKTTLMMAIAVETALQGKDFLWGAPTHKQTLIGWEEAQKACGSYAQFKVTDMFARFPTKGRIFFRSMDEPDNARGLTVDGVGLDEAPFLKESVWYEVVRPMLLDTGGFSWCGGTPNGQNWYWRECMMALERDDSMFWQAPTLGVIITKNGLVREPHKLENPDIKFLEMEQLFRTLPERAFRQEILAEFIEDAGGVFRGVHACIDGGRKDNEPPSESFQYIGGIDLAKSNDFTVITVLDDLGRQVYHERFNEISWHRQRESVKRVFDTYRCPFVIDATGVGDPVVEGLEEMGIECYRVVLNNTNKNQMIDKLAIAIENRDLCLMDIASQTSELTAYQYSISTSRNIKSGAPEGMHDDTVIALALAWSRCVIMSKHKQIVASSDFDSNEYDSDVRASTFY